jgi:hypothetical protein
LCVATRSTKLHFAGTTGLRDNAMLHTDFSDSITDNLSYVDEPLSSAAASSPDALVLMQCVLEQMDYGLALVHMVTRQIRFSNRLAYSSLQGAGSARSGLCITDGRLTTLLNSDEAQLEHALLRAQSGVRALISLGGEDCTTSVAVVPLTAPGAGPFALLVFAKQQLCDSSTIALFARERGLTRLKAMCWHRFAVACAPRRSPNAMACRYLPFAASYAVFG